MQASVKINRTINKMDSKPQFGCVLTLSAFASPSPTGIILRNKSKLSFGGTDSLLGIHSLLINPGLMQICAL